MFRRWFSQYQTKIGIILGIFLFAGILILPQILIKGVIAGSDFLFHYNRFYETAQQIKTGNFSYFLSLYGFQSTGRIINALYGPYFAYFQGLLVLLSGTWYKYQLLSRFLVASLAGASMYSLSHRGGVRRRISFGLALFYMTTFSIQYWTMRQGFSSWGAAVLPWCLIPALDVIQKKQISILRLAVSVSLMVQIHMLSAFLLVLMYIPFYIYGFAVSREKWTILRKGALAVGLTLLLTANVWVALLEVGMGNELVQPFINPRLYIMTVNQRSIQWLLTPLPLLFLVLYQFYYTFHHWREYEPVLKVVHITYGIFLVLSSSIFPWYKVAQLDLSLVNLIQFPFRFFIPATVLLLLGMGLVFDRYCYKKWPRTVMVFLAIGVIWGGKQVIDMTSEELTHYQTTQTPVKNQKHQFVLGTAQEVRDSFHSSDLNDMLQHILKSTPDYLPTDKQNTENKYDLYEEYVLNQPDIFSKSQEGDKLILTWESDSTGTIQLPVIKYAKTQLVLNGKTLTEKDYTLSAIGNPTVKQQVGTNRLELTYRIGTWFLYLLVLNVLVWLAVLCAGVVCFLKNRKSTRSHGLIDETDIK